MSRVKTYLERAVDQIELMDLNYSISDQLAMAQALALISIAESLEKLVESVDYEEYRREMLAARE